MDAKSISTSGSIEPGVQERDGLPNPTSATGGRSQRKSLIQRFKGCKGQDYAGCSPWARAHRASASSSGRSRAPLPASAGRHATQLVKQLMMAVMAQGASPRYASQNPAERVMLRTANPQERTQSPRTLRNSAARRESGFPEPPLLPLGGPCDPLDGVPDELLEPDWPCWPLWLD